jgi:DNA-binding MarR family transcriptional regulator
MQDVAYVATGRDEQGLHEVRAELFGSLFVLLQNLSRRTDGELERFGLTSRQWLLIAVIDTAFPEQAPTMAEAAAAYGSSRQNVAQIAQQLVARGYLRIEPDDRDRRAVRLVLTARRAVFDDPVVRAEQAQVLADMFGALSPSEVRVLRDLVVRCVAHNTAENAPPRRT